MDLEEYRVHFNLNNHFLKLLGAELMVLKEGYAEVELTTQESLSNINHMLHGGALFSLADTAVGAASKAYGKNSVTLEGKLNYIRGVRGYNEKIKAIANICHGGKRTQVYECKIVNEQGSLIATGLFTMYVLDQEIGS